MSEQLTLLREVKGLLEHFLTQNQSQEVDDLAKKKLTDLEGVITRLDVVIEEMSSSGNQDPEYFSSLVFDGLCIAAKFFLKIAEHEAVAVISEELRRIFENMI